MAVQELADERLFTGDDPAHEVAFEALESPERPIARFERPTATGPTRIALLSDPHVATEATGSWKMYHHTRDRFREALAALDALDVDAALVTGDLTRDGEPANFAWIQSVLEGTEVPVHAVPGNHDVAEEHVDRFEARFADGGFPLHHRHNGVDLVGLNSAMTPDADDPVEGVVSDAQLEWLDATLPETTDPVVFMHHNLPGLAEHIGDLGWDPHPPVENADALLDVLAEHDVPLHLSGHVHLLAHTRSRDVNGLIAPALSSFPQAFLLLDIDETGTTVSAHSTAGPAALEEAYETSQSYSTRSRVISELSAERLANVPLVDERTDGVRT